MTGSQICPHINPRLYLQPPFGCEMQSILTEYSNPRSLTLMVVPVDLADLAEFSQKLQYSEEMHLKYDRQWKITIRNAEVDHDDPSEMHEIIVVRPVKSHEGRRFTIAIAYSQERPLWNRQM